MIADHVSTTILEYQHFVNFKLVARKNLDAIENEILITNGSMTGNILDYISGADILITGTWRSGKKYTYLTIKAFDIKKKGTFELVSKQTQIEQHTLSEYFPDCFESTSDKQAKKAQAPEHQSVVLVNKNSHAIKIKVKGNSPPNCSLTCRMQKAIKNNRKMAVDFLLKTLNINQINSEKLKLDHIEYHHDQSATTIYTYNY